MRIKEIAYHTVGRVQQALTNYSDAAENYASGLTVGRSLADRAPENAGFQSDLAARYWDVGVIALLREDYASAVDAFRQRYQVFERLLKQSPNVRDWHDGIRSTVRALGLTHQSRGDIPAKLSLYESYLGFLLRRAEREEQDAGAAGGLSEGASRVGDPLIQSDLASWHLEMGGAYRDATNYDGALDQLKKSLEVWSKLAASEPANTPWQTNLANVHLEAARLFRLMKRDDEARVSHVARIQLLGEVATREPAEFRWAVALVHAFSDLDELLRSLKDSAALRRHWEDAVDRMQRLHVAAKAANLPTGEAESLVTVCTRLAQVHIDAGNPALARAALAKEVSAREEIVAASPTASHLGNLSFSCLEAGEFRKSKEAAMAGLRAKPDAIWIQGNLAHAHMFLGEREAAMAIHRQFKDAPDVKIGSTAVSWAEATASDFEILRKLGLDHPVMREIEALLR